MKKGAKITLLGLAALIAFGLLLPPPKSDAPTTANDVQTTHQLPEYVITREQLPPDRAEYTVLIHQRLDKPALQAIVDHLRKENPRDKFMVLFMLDDPASNERGHPSGYAGFDSNFGGLKLYGATAKEEASVSDLEFDIPGAQVIGKWLDMRSTQRQKIFLYSLNGKLFLRTAFSATSFDDAELKSENAGRGKQKLIDQEDLRRWYVLTEQGDLEYWSKDGRFFVPEKVN